jgi:hypothetical protein
MEQLAAIPGDPNVGHARPPKPHDAAKLELLASKADVLFLELVGEHLVQDVPRLETANAVGVHRWHSTQMLMHPPLPAFPPPSRDRSTSYPWHDSQSGELVFHPLPWLNTEDVEQLVASVNDFVFWCGSAGRAFDPSACEAHSHDNHLKTDHSERNSHDVLCALLQTSPTGHKS